MIGGGARTVSMTNGWPSCFCSSLSDAAIVRSGYERLPAADRGRKRFKTPEAPLILAAYRLVMRQSLTKAVNLIVMTYIGKREDFALQIRTPWCLIRKIYLTAFEFTGLD